MIKENVNDKMKILGKNIRYFRELQNLTQEILAYRAEIGSAHLGNIERGSCNPTFDTLNKIACGLGLDMQLLFEGINSDICGDETHKIQCIQNLYRELDEDKRAAFWNLIDSLITMTNGKSEILNTDITDK